MAGAEVSWRDRPRRRLASSRPARMPEICWRCQKRKPADGHASCSVCLAFMEERAAELREGRATWPK
jgi:hypothetical protein